MASHRKPRTRQYSSYPSPKKGGQTRLLLALIVVFAAGFTWINRSVLRLGIPTNTIPNPKMVASPPAISAGSGETIHQGNYRSIDEQARAIDYRGNSVSELAALLSRHATTEADKARIIYTWIAQNIAYDVQGYVNQDYGDVSPSGVLSDRSTVCGGYANLYEALAKAMGLEAIVIEGYGRGSDYLVGNSNASNHAWNGVKINNDWYLIDTTWGAGTVNNDTFQREFNPYYFATPPEQMIYNHFPAQSSWQLLPIAYTKEQFDALPNISSQFFIDKLQLVSHKTNTIQASGTAEILLQIPPEIQISARLQQNATPLNDNYTFVQEQNGQTTIKVAFPATGTYELQIFSKKRSDTGYFQRALSYQVIANASGETFPKIYGTFGQSRTYLYAPTTGKLPPDQFVDFQLEVPNALEVAVIDNASQVWTPLTRSGSLFTGNVRVGTGKISVAAKFAEGEQYMTLLEYN